MEWYVNKKVANEGYRHKIPLRKIFNFHLKKQRTRFFLAFVFLYLLLFHNFSEVLEVSVNRLSKIVMSKGGSLWWYSNCERFNENAFTASRKPRQGFRPFTSAFKVHVFIMSFLCNVLQFFVYVHKVFYASFYNVNEWWLQFLYSKKYFNLSLSRSLL